ncbi:MAG: MBL fold metallo-hydrolase [Clostridiales bacterium]|jgi:glyoxylase-like metal-dependent hydrolase (beta-lactamase superfamily II)|nr:MBL fold metallo-hydrolase [Bacillota bacterium]NLK03077.1 MBL fold metallo-hydrolase [Clostridiales bacterium]
MRRIHIKTMVLGMVQTNCYIVREAKSKEAIVIDPGDNAERINEYLKENDLKCKAILLTHGHFDHITAANELKNLTTAPIYAHENEVELLNDSRLNASIQMGTEVKVIPDILLKDKEEFQAAGLLWRVIYTPGHTAGGVCYYIPEEGVIFSGDSLFYESIGRTDFPTGNHSVLLEKISSQLMVLEDRIEVYPGHGRPTTIGHERHNNPYL